MTFRCKCHVDGGVRDSKRLGLSPNYSFLTKMHFTEVMTCLATCSEDRSYYSTELKSALTAPFGPFLPFLLPPQISARLAARCYRGAIGYVYFFVMLVEDGERVGGEGERR